MRPVLTFFSFYITIYIYTNITTTSFRVFFAGNAHILYKITLCKTPRNLPVRTKGEQVMMEFINKCIDYLKANPLYAGIIAAALVAVIVLLIVIIAVSSKRKKAKKLAAAQANTAQAQAQAASTVAVDAEEEKSKKAEEAEKARQATLARLEAEEKAAEQEEAEAKAKAEAEAKSKEEAKEDAKKETPAPAPKKTTKKKATPKAEPVKEEVKEETAEEKPAPAPVPAPAPKKAAKKATPKTEEKKEEAVALYDEMKDAEEEDEAFYDENETEKLAKYTGKWTICHILTEDNSEDDMYFFELHASNGEKLLSSEEYTSYAGALRGIETHKANILKGNFRITLSKKGDYIFKLLSGKNMLLCMGENYSTRARCESAINSTKRFARTAVLDENVQDQIVKVPTEDETEVLPPPEGYNGKWLITSREDGEGEKVYFFELFANNGEKLLSSEEYTTYVGAVNGIQTHKANIEKGNFRISLTKRGDYIYKLLNGNGQLLCLGEHYKTKTRCESAVESVKRFAINSPVLTDSKTTK